MITLTKHVIPGSDLHCAGSWHFRDFCNIFLPNRSEDQKKKILLLERGALALRHMANTALVVLHDVHKKLRWGLRYQLFWTKTLDFTRVVSLNWLEKNWIKEVRRAPWSSILFIVKYCYTRVLLHAKMLKETENEKNKAFLSNFCHWWHFDWGGPGPLSHPPGYAYDFEIRSRP